MEFLHVDADNPNSAVDSIRVNWYYRPRDVLRFSTDTRLVFGTMHSDMCPLTSLRGKCTIKHRSEIEDLEAYRKERDSFFFVQVFDRFIRRSYECIPVQQIINVPEKVKKALDERWKFVVVEIGRVKELTSAAKTCKRCTRYCASTDSVDCAICKNAYHMNCVQPPLPKKPSRGFAWACGPCSRASEQKLDNSTPTETEADEEEPVEEEEIPAGSQNATRAPSPSGSDMVVDDHPATQAEIALAKMWPMRYLGIHARVEDALQYDDRAIYPRASSRLGPRHQANVNMWHGQPVELVKPAEIKKRYHKGNAQKKEGKLSKETLAIMEADREEKAKRPRWVQDEPVGYVARGEDFDAKDPRCTARLMFKMPPIDEKPGSSAMDQAVAKNNETVDTYINRAKACARGVGVPPFGTNFLDKAFELYTANKYNQDAALKQLQKVDRIKDLHEPVLSKTDLFKFEDGVAKYGSEHRLVRLHMKTQLPNSDIVRFYYLWKKTPKGREIWGNYGGRKKRKVENDSGARLQAEVANEADDSAFDNDKAMRKNRGFQCKFCNTTHSRQWRRAPGVSPGQTAPVPEAAKGANKDQRSHRPLLALCLRCCGLWRKYAIQWEEFDEATKKLAAAGGRGLKRKFDEELLREIIADCESPRLPAYEPALQSIETGEPPKKKSKIQDAQATVPAQKKEKPPPPPKEPTPPPPPIIPAQPTWKKLPCAICKGFDDTVACSHCKLTVHRRCFGIGENEGVRADGGIKWVCEQCQNDRNPTVSTDYSCCLCLTEETLVDLVEPPKISHKKKTDREREKERLEKELADNMRAEYRSKQLNMNRAQLPREPLKRTTGNNWVHVYCAVWAPEIRFSNWKTMEVAEGVQLIPQPRFEAVCKLCKNKDHQNRVCENAGACVNCFQCNASFHASCAFEAGYTFGFDVTPVKGSRKDQVTTATLGQETGAVTAVIMCKEHVVKTIIHPIAEIQDETGTTALQIYVENYKQADLTLTGTVRKANLAQLTRDKSQLSVFSGQSGARRESGVHSIAAAVRRGGRTSAVSEMKADAEDGATDVSSLTDIPAGRRCIKCDIDVTPKWHPIPRQHPPEEAAPTAQPTKPAQSSNSITMGGTDGLTGSAEAAGGVENVADVCTKPTELEKPPAGPGAMSASIPSLQPIGGPMQASGEQQHTDDSSGWLITNRKENNRQSADDGYHKHALPHYQNPAAAASPETSAANPDLPPDYMCHRCFQKAPTPPPEENSAMEVSPPRSLASTNGVTNKPAKSIEEQFLVWDVPPREPTPPPIQQPQMNGHGPPLSYGQHPQTPYDHMFHAGPPAPHYGHPPSAYMPGPPQGPPMHDRHNSYGYPPQGSPPVYGQQGSPHMPSFAPQRHPPQMNGYPQPNQSTANGMQSPRNPQGPPVQSPGGYQHPQTHHLPPHMQRNDRPYSGGPQLYQYAASMHAIGQEFPPQQQHQPQPPPQPQQQQPQQQQAPALPAQPPAPAQNIDPQLMSAGPPPPGPGWAHDSQQQQPTTPRGGPMNGAPPAAGGNGASASPSLANLIH